MPEPDRRDFCIACRLGDPILYMSENNRKLALSGVDQGLADCSPPPKWGSLPVFGWLAV